MVFRGQIPPELASAKVLKSLVSSWNASGLSSQRAHPLLRFVGIPYHIRQAHQKRKNGATHDLNSSFLIAYFIHKDLIPICLTAHFSQTRKFAKVHSFGDEPQIHQGVATQLERRSPQQREITCQPDDKTWQLVYLLQVIHGNIEIPKLSLARAPPCHVVHHQPRYSLSNTLQIQLVLIVIYS